MLPSDKAPWALISRGGVTSKNEFLGGTYLRIYSIVEEK